MQGSFGQRIELNAAASRLLPIVTAPEAAVGAASASVAATAMPTARTRFFTGSRSSLGVYATRLAFPDAFPYVNYETGTSL